MCLQNVSTNLGRVAHRLYVKTTLLYKIYIYIYIYIICPYQLMRCIKNNFWGEKTKQELITCKQS